MMKRDYREFNDVNNQLFARFIDPMRESDVRNFNRWLLENDIGIQWTIFLDKYVYQVIDEKQWKIAQIRWGIFEHDVTEQR